MQALGEQPEACEFMALVQFTGMHEQLQNDPSLTVLLTQVLSYHAVPGKVRAKDVPAGALSVTTVQGARFTLTRVGSSLHIRDARNRGANVITTDIQVSNGVVHVNNRVILPPA